VTAADDVLDLVQRYVERLDTSLTAGPLRAWQELVDEARAGEDVEREAEIVRIGVDVIDDRAAVVALEGELVTRVAGRRHRFALGGPVAVERTADGWRVVDFVLDGRRRLDCIRIGPFASYEAAGVRATVEATSDDRAGASAVVTVESRRAGGAAVAEAWVGNGLRWRCVQVRPLALEPGERRQALVAIGGIGVPRTRVRRLVLTGRAGDDRFVLDLPVEPPDGEPRSSLPAGVRLARTPLPFYGWIAVLTAVMWTTPWRRGYALALLAFAAWLLALALRARARGRRPNLRRLSLSLAPLVALAVVLRLL
jgi:hypothetical protein